VNQSVSALKFLYLKVLEMPWSDDHFPRAKRPHKLPVILSPEEVSAFFDHVPSLRYRAALMACYGAGLRVSEAVALKVGDIDSQRMLIRVEQGKGRKDRYAMLSERLLKVLRIWWRAARPEGYLFPGWRSGKHMSSQSLQTACREAARASPSASPSTRCATASPPTCWKTAPTCASSRRCSATAASTPRPTTRRSRTV
jgi:integrase/recombinase XerD